MRILVGAWFSLPRLGREAFSLLMKEGVAYDKDMGFKLDSGTDLPAAARTLSTALGEEVELTLRCFVCVPGTTLVIGDNKRIQNSRPMDHSVGATGLGQIKKRFSRQYDGDILRIKATGLLPLETTPEHPILVSTSTTRRDRSTQNRQKIKFSELYWKEASNLTCKKEGVEGDYLFIPSLRGSFASARASLGAFTNANGQRVCKSKNFPLEIPLNSETAWLIGIYVAEGFPSSSAACFSLNHDETRIHQRIIEIGTSLGYSPSKYRAPTSTVVVIPSRILSRALAAWCGKGARRKHFPDFVLFHKDPRILDSALNGYVAGDGYRFGSVSSMSTTSKLLALQLQLLGARLGEFVSIRRSKSEGGVIDGRKIAGGADGKYVLELRPRSNQSFARVTDRGILTPVRRVERVPFSGKVYNIETSDNTYLVSNAVVHNCGRQACAGCPYIDSCDRTAFSTLCLCGEHSPEKSAAIFGLYSKTFEMLQRAE